MDTNSSIPPYGPNPTPNLRYYSFTQGAASAPEQVSDPVSQPATYSQIGAVHKRPKFTAKEQRSPSPRTRQEAPGADPPIVNRPNAGTVPAFCSGVSGRGEEGNARSHRRKGAKGRGVRQRRRRERKVAKAQRCKGKRGKAGEKKGTQGRKGAKVQREDSRTVG